MLKIVYCNPSINTVAGMERVLVVKANYFAEKLGYEVHIIITDGRQQPPAFALHPSIKVHQLDINYEDYPTYPPCKRIFEFFRKRYLHKKRLNRCLAQIQPDITIFMTRREVGFINSIHNKSIKIAEVHFDKRTYKDAMNPHLAKFLPKWLIRKIQNDAILALRKLDRLIVLTHVDAATWTELQNVVVIPNPITITPKGVSSCDKKKVIAVGRYERTKGFDMLLDAWKIVSDKHKDWTLHIYGEGSLREKLEKQLVSLGLEGLCFLEHKTAAIGECYKNSSLYVLSSHFEGFGLVIVEAMAYGLPVVSYACPCGPKDIINDGVDGFLVEPNNVEELARKISYMIENDELRKRMGRQASINVQRFGIERVGEMWKQLFEELLKEKNNK